eukprot:11363674-Alexandrium_andersonii.AAC.1
MLSVWWHAERPSESARLGSSELRECGVAGAEESSSAERPADSADRARTAAVVGKGLPEGREAVGAA